jgi:predicted Zn-dependent protease
MKFKICMKKYFVNSVLLGAIIFTTSTSGNAQDTPATTEEKTTASLYNDGVAALREKDFKTGFTLLESAFKKAKEENNEEVLGLAKKNSISAAFNYGNDLLKNKNPKEALDVFQRGLAIDETASLLHQGSGRAKEDANDIEGAVASYTTYLEMAKAEKDDKKIGDAESKVKNLLLKQLNAKAYARVIKLGNEFLEKGKNAEISYLVGKAYADKGDATNGIKYLLESVEQSTAAGEKVEDKVNYALGMAYDGKKDKANAIKYFSMITDPKYKAAAQSMITRLNAAK